MIKMKSSIIERLIICWNVLTKRNYIYFGVGRNPIIWNEDGTFKETKKGEIKFYEYIDKQYVFNTNDGVKSLHDFLWKTVGDIVKKALEGEY